MPLLLCLLVKNGKNITTHDEIVSAIWNDVPISDAAIASRIRSVRAALGDNGVQQYAIQTIRGRGVRFILAVTIKTAARLAETIASNEGTAPSIAVLPFQAFGEMEPARIFAPALAHELVVSLS